ncbi:MAG TPA: DUF481 domain-containing protein [Myxococcota bacterium]|nr:DUF481 domain-containing protein [Myxococcota bacterium]
MRANSTRALRRAAFLVSLLAISAAPSARADVVRMKSGDVVSGKIKEISDEELVIDPKFSDDIDIKLKYIASIETDRPVSVTFRDGSVVTGFVELAPDGTMRVRAAPSRWDERGHRGPLLARPSTTSGVQEGFELARVQELESAYYRYEAELGLGLNAASGNTDSSSLDVDAELEPHWGPNTFRLDGQVNRGESNGRETANNWRIGLQYERELRGGWQAFLYTREESDEFQDLDLRAVIAAGPGYELLARPDTDLRMYAGPAWVKENYAGSASDRSFAAFAWVTTFEQDLFSSDFTLFHQSQLIKAVGDEPFLAQTSQGVDMDLWGNLDLKLELQFDYASDPVQSVQEKGDLRYIVKLEYELEGDETDWWQ